jgi:hypothetical protein
MFKRLRGLFSSRPGQAEPAAWQAWAGDKGHIEWGPAQRDYISGFELRLIAELELPRDLLALVLNRRLMEAMEADVYERYVDAVQTRMDAATPAEMRWLVMFAKLPAHELGRLAERYGAVGSAPQWLLQWLHGPLNDALAATVDAVAPEQPVVLTIGRGRLMLRTPMPQPVLEALLPWLSVFEHALREASRLGGSAGPSGLPPSSGHADLGGAERPPAARQTERV